MLYRYLLAVSFGLMFSSAHAVVVVNGTTGEHGDALPPFETLQAAIEYSNNNVDQEIELQTDGPIGGASLAGIGLNHNLTIKAGAGFNPHINTGLVLIPTTTTSSVSLIGLKVITSGLGTPLLAGCTITATNCDFDTTPVGGGAYGPAVTASIESVASSHTLTMNNCSLKGHVGLEAGRACRDYILTNCTVVGQTTDLPPIYSHGISNSMNWRSGYASRLGTAEGFVEISEPRTVTLNSCVVRAGLPFAWPPSTLAGFYTNENSTIGPIIATNTTFDYLNTGGPGEAARIGIDGLPANQNPGSTFLHCTFRSVQAWGALYFPGGQPATHKISNCLLDLPLSNYGIITHANATLTGDANTYHMVAGQELFPFVTTPAFEATEHTYMGTPSNDPPLTDSNGNLLTPNAAVVAKALALVPPVTTDKHGEARPLPLTAIRSDVGADEINEEVPAAVTDWHLF